MSFEGKGDFSLPYLREVVQGFMFRDGFRAVDTTGDGITWSNSRGSRSRIDFIFVPVNANVRSAVVSPVWFSDHSQLLVTFTVAVPHFGRGFWKLNSKVLGEAAFQKCFIAHYEVWVLLKPYFGSVVEWWECVKRNTRVLTVSHCAAKARAGREEFFGLQRSLQNLVVAENNGEGVDREGMEAVKKQLGHYFREKARDFLFRCQRECFEFGGVCSAYFFKQVKAARTKVCIPHLRGRDGGLISDPEGMVEVASGFFEEAFGERTVDDSGAGRFLGGLRGRVPGVVAENLERPVTMAEVESAMMGLPAGKVPGIDGLPTEFYVAFWGVLGRDFLGVVNSVLDGGL